MNNFRLVSISSLLMLLIIGCATVGKTFKYENREMIELNKTTINQALQVLGDPYSREAKTDKYGNFTILKYIYAYGNLAGSAARVFFLEFKNDTLNAKIYNSGFDEDITDFNYDNYTKIKVNESRMEDVKNILGDPTGIANCPTTLEDYSKKCENASIIWLWIHTTKSQGLNTKSIKSKTIKVSFNKNGIVNDVDTSSDL